MVADEEFGAGSAAQATTDAPENASAISTDVVFFIIGPFACTTNSGLRQKLASLSKWIVISPAELTGHMDSRSDLLFTFP